MACTACNPILFILVSPLIVMSSWGYSHTIYINPVSGEDVPGCLAGNSSLPCQNLTWVFQQGHSDSTHYVLSEGQHYLTETTPPFRNLTSLAITSAGSAVVTCTDLETGLAFINVVNVTLSDVAFFQCAAVRNSTSKNFVNMSISQFQVGLYFYLCENINMSHVSVSHSPDAMGVVIYDTNGTNTFSYSNFSYNSVSNDSVYPGGGGFYVEFTYCEPGVLSCATPTTGRNKGARYIFTSCEFSHNKADNYLDREEHFTYIFPYQEDHQSFGRGGGLVLFIRGNASEIDFTIERSKFYNNTAVWGGGLLIELHDNVHGSKIEVNDTEFYGNWCPYTATSGTAGGGIMLAHYVYGLEAAIPKTATRNAFEIDNCTFVANSALNGAGISVSWSRQQRTSVEQVAHIHISRSSFRQNNAKLGAAIHVDQYWLVLEGLVTKVWIDSCNFDRNTDQYFRKIESGKPVQVGMGIVCVTSSNVWFRNRVSFTNNNGSALAVSGGSVSFNGTSVLFENNTAFTGAGIFLLGASTIELGFGTKMVFRNNAAVYRGGAIHAVYISRENLKTDAKCFLRFVNPTTTPADWNVTVLFVDNWEFQHTSYNAIYSTAILPCSVLGGSGVSNESEVLCWKGWSYYAGEKQVECDSQIATAIGYMEYNGTNGSNHIQAFPGWTFEMPLLIKNDLDEVIGNDVVSMVSHHGSRHEQALFYGENATVYGQENKTYNMTLMTFGERAWYGEFYVDLQQCPPGFSIHNGNGSCICAGDYSGHVICNLKAKEAWLAQGYWMTLFRGSYYIAQCPPGFCRDFVERFILLPHNYTDLNSTLCAPNRTGPHCGECVLGYGPAVNSRTYECINCTDINLGANIAKYVASIYLPLAALFTILILFDIRLTTGPANSFILYCQVVASTFSLDANGGIPLNQVVNHPTKYILAYRIFNLEFIENFLPLICLSANFNTLTVLCLDYCVAFSPLIMIAVVLVILKLKERCTFSVKRISPMSMSKFFKKKNRSIDEALLPAFASFLLLSYTKFSIVSASTLTTNIPIDANGSSYSAPESVYLAGQFNPHDKEYYPYYVAAVIVCCTFVSIPPLLLLDYPLRVVEWFVSKSRCLQRLYPTDKVHIFLDAFQGCYKNDMRFFAGLYFLFRLFINVMSFRFLNTWAKIYMTQQITCTVMVTLIAICQPYKAKFLNYVDILIFTNLAIINSMTHYLFESSKNHNSFTPSRSVFAIQYVLVFLPLIYMLIYVMWRKTEKYHGLMKRTLLRCCLTSPRYQNLESIVRDNLSVTMPDTDVSAFSTEATSPPHGSDLDAIIERSKDPNMYRSQVSVTVVGMNEEDCDKEGEASVRQLPHESEECAKLLDSGMDSGGCVLHGSTNSSTAPSDRTDSARSTQS